MSDTTVANDHQHRWLWAGTSLPLEHVDCDRPKLLRCECGDELRLRCQTGSRALCGPCSRMYRARVSIIGVSGVLRVPGRSTWFLTLTAPSDRGQHCRRHRDCEAFGPSCDPCPCTPVGGIDIGCWNRDHGQRWNRFCQALRRMLGEHVEYFRGVELQERGALHDHALIRFRTGTVVDFDALRALAIHHGFGHSIDWRHAEEAHALYAAKYASKSVDDRKFMPWADEHGRHVPGNRRFRTWTASRRWGTTMRALKSNAVEWARSGAGAGERSEAPDLLTTTASVTQATTTQPPVSASSSAV